MPKEKPGLLRVREERGMVFVQLPDDMYFYLPPADARAFAMSLLKYSARAEGETEGFVFSVDVTA